MTSALTQPALNAIDIGHTAPLLFSQPPSSVIDEQRIKIDGVFSFSDGTVEHVEGHPRVLIDAEQCISEVGT